MSSLFLILSLLPSLISPFFAFSLEKCMMAVIALLPLAYHLTGILSFAYSTDLVLRYKGSVGNAFGREEGNDEDEAGFNLKDPHEIPLPRTPSIVERYLLEEELEALRPSFEFLARPDPAHEVYLCELEKVLAGDEDPEVVRSRAAAERLVRFYERIAAQAMKNREQRASEEEKVKAVADEEEEEKEKKEEEKEEDVVVVAGPAASPPLELVLTFQPKNKAEDCLDSLRNHKRPRLAPAPPTTAYVASKLRRHHSRRPRPRPKFVSCWEETVRPLVEHERRLIRANAQRGVLGLRRSEPSYVPPPPSPIGALRSVERSLLEEDIQFLPGLIQRGLDRVEELNQLLETNRARIVELDSREYLWEDTASEITSEDEASIPVAVADGTNVFWAQPTWS